jgi:hypothetical protein
MQVLKTHHASHLLVIVVHPYVSLLCCPQDNYYIQRSDHRQTATKHLHGIYIGDLKPYVQIRERP